MTTSIEIDDKLMEEVLRLSKAKTKQEAIEAALENYLRVLSQGGLLEFRGKVRWEGDLDEMRSQ